MIGRDHATLVLDRDGDYYVLRHGGRGTLLRAVDGPFRHAEAVEEWLKDHALHAVPPSRAMRGVYFGAEIIGVQMLRSLERVPYEVRGTRRLYTLVRGQDE